jgi:threonine dehydratase
MQEHEGAKSLFEDKDFVGSSISLVDIFCARKRIRDISSHTPLVYSPQLSKHINAEVFLKLENFQPIKVFKIRGAANKLSKLPVNSHVVTASSGNHGFAVSYVSKLLNHRATVCVPENANPDKINNIRMFEAEMVTVGTSYEDAYAEARRIERETSAIFVHAYEDPDVIAGQGTIGLEILEDLPDVDDVIVPVGGGGLISGISSAIKSIKMQTRIIGVQTSNAPTMAHAFRTGELCPPTIAKTIADGLVTRRASPITLKIIKRNVDEMMIVEDEQIEKSILLLINNDHVLVEPSGAVPVAAILDNAKFFKGRKVVLVLSGGNISIQYLKDLLSRN